MKNHRAIPINSQVSAFLALGILFLSRACAADNSVLITDGLKGTPYYDKYSTMMAKRLSGYLSKTTSIRISNSESDIYGETSYHIRIMSEEIDQAGYCDCGNGPEMQFTILKMKTTYYYITQRPAVDVPFRNVALITSLCSELDVACQQNFESIKNYLTQRKNTIK